ncbi:F0F1 ATP synthase subunit epsilon [Prosthecomicrobium hirschii]|uniref:F0F1 ATP synthase subunit epsilon n=1 Tax=Prosthecodimorpha hirschii TaxID=665126 RepID=UPI0022209929|nr:F0F1 ATP synthase subunit epsilon [Prosthecomicrobium hirschii]MCW1841388.1 F0F1 ATP synthase subunit epsilon [Prosthecomicrobium hirschii]
MAEAFKFELVSPERLLVSEEVAQVVVPGSEGQFTMLKGHAPFMTTMRPGVIEVTGQSGTVSRIFVRGGFADASPAGLTVLAEMAVPVQDLKAEQIAREIKNAEEDVADAGSDETKRVAQEKLDQLREVQAALGASAAH